MLRCCTLVDATLIAVTCVPLDIRYCTLVDATLIAATCVPIRCYIAVRWWMLRCCNLRVSACYVAVTCVPLDAVRFAKSCERPHWTSQHSCCALYQQTPRFGKCLKSTSSFSKAGNEELPQAKLSVQGSTLGRLKERKKADSQDAEVSVMLKITENYQWKTTSYQSTCGNAVFCKLLEHFFLIKEYAPRKSNGKNTEPVKIKPNIIIIQLQLRRTKKNWSVMEIRHW